MSLSNAASRDVGEFAMPDPEKTRGSLKVVGGSENVGDEALRMRLQRYMDAHPHLTTAILAHSDHTGVSRTLLDSYLEGKYFLPKSAGGMGVDPRRSDKEAKIREYLNRVDGMDHQGFKIDFAQTVLWSQFQFMCNTAIEESIIAAGYGSPGHGKTRAMFEYMQEKMTMRPALIYCSPNITTGYFVRKIAMELKVKANAIIPEVEDRIVDRLLKNKRAIFVDQANFLNVNAIGTICYIWDRARVPIVLTGTEKLHDLFLTLSDSEGIRGQFVSRMALFVPLMGMSLDESNGVIQQALGRHATPEVVAQIFGIISRNYTADAETQRLGSFRNLMFLLPRLATLIAKNEDDIDQGEVDLNDLVANAASRLILG